MLKQSAHSSQAVRLVGFSIGREPARGRAIAHASGLGCSHRAQAVASSAWWFSSCTPLDYGRSVGVFGCSVRYRTSLVDCP
eukprot:5553859-Pyramimonas_sp.AAC.1